jgi:hypothetical protein
MDNQISADCARFIADYINELVTQGKTIDKFAIMGALVAYITLTVHLSDDKWLDPNSYRVEEVAA